MRIECSYRRQRAVEPLDLDYRELSGAALCELRRAGVARQDIRVAVHTYWLVGSRVLRVVPGAGRKLHDAGAQRLAQHGARKACATIVVEAHDIAAANASRRGVLRMDADRLAALDL